VKILITGSAGFIGSHLERDLRSVGHEVYGHDRENGDLLEPGMFSRSLATFKPDVVVHLAAKVGRLFGEDDPLLTVSDNAGMTAMIAQVCGESGTKLAYASTSEVYGDGSEREWKESDLGQADPHNLYGLSKRWGEEVCRLYAPKGLQVFRLSMPYGPGLPAGRGRAALVNFLDQAANRRRIPVHRGAERSWCWVGDTARGMRLILQNGSEGAWNVGRDDNSLPMTEVAKMACDLVGAPYSLIEEVEAPKRQTVIKRLSTEKLMALGWKPHVELEEGMERTWKWMRSLQEEAA